nr:sulfatase-like hydrolase/transferase [Paracoccus sp. S-4012]
MFPAPAGTGPRARAATQRPGVRAYKDYVDLHFGRIPDDRPDLWLRHRNYLVNCMRLADREFGRIVEAVDRLDLWPDTVVILTGDHGEMNGAHRMTQKAGIAFEEATVVNLTVCAPEGRLGARTGAVGSHLDLAPTLLAYAGLSDAEIGARYPHLKGRSLKGVIDGADRHGPRGSSEQPGDGALICWDGLHALDNDWSLSGALKSLTSMGSSPSNEQQNRGEQLREAGERFGAPDYSKRTFFRAVVDGRHKLVRWFSPEDYANPATLEELLATSDLGLYDLERDPGELQNLAHPDHPDHDLALIARMGAKLHALVEREIGEDRRPFDLDMFGTREVRQG